MLFRSWEEYHQIFDNMQKIWYHLYDPPAAEGEPPKPPSSPPLPPQTPGTQLFKEIKWGKYGACVPPGDKRSINLQQCATNEEALYRGLFYINRRAPLLPRPRHLSPRPPRPPSRAGRRSACSTRRRSGSASTATRS